MAVTFKRLNELRIELVAHTLQCSHDDDGIRWYEEADTLPVSAARVSHGNEDKTGDDPAKDLKLMRFLAEHKHFSPFEHMSMTLLIECPMFVRSQIHRHRTFSYNEISRRYTSDDADVFYLPDTFRAQAKSNKQCSTGEVEDQPLAKAVYCKAMEDAYRGYTSMLELGVAREIARAALPASAITRFYMTGNLRNWAAFIKLRDDPHAQLEVQHVAKVAKSELLKLWPTAAGVMLENT